MTAFIETLKRQYTAKKITDEKLNTYLADGKITQEEYDYIKGVVKDESQPSN